MGFLSSDFSEYNPFLKSAPYVYDKQCRSVRKALAITVNVGTIIGIIL